MTERIEGDVENALQALDNIASWKKKDGSINYVEYYAYKVREVIDDGGSVIKSTLGSSI